MPDEPDATDATTWTPGTPYHWTWRPASQMTGEDGPELYLGDLAHPVTPEQLMAATPPEDRPEVERAIELAQRSIPVFGVLAIPGLVGMVVGAAAALFGLIIGLTFLAVRAPLPLVIMPGLFVVVGLVVFVRSAMRFARREATPPAARPKAGALDPE